MGFERLKMKCKSGNVTREETEQTRNRNKLSFVFEDPDE